MIEVEDTDENEILDQGLPENLHWNKAIEAHSSTHLLSTQPKVSSPTYWNSCEVEKLDKLLNFCALHTNDFVHEILPSDQKHADSQLLLFSVGSVSFESNTKMTWAYSAPVEIGKTGK